MPTSRWAYTAAHGWSSTRRGLFHSNHMRTLNLTPVLNSKQNADRGFTLELELILNGD